MLDREGRSIQGLSVTCVLYPIGERVQVALSTIAAHHVLMQELDAEEETLLWDFEAQFRGKLNGPLGVLRSVHLDQLLQECNIALGNIAPPKDKQQTPNSGRSAGATSLV